MTADFRKINLRIFSCACFMLSILSLSSQCNITYTGNACVGDPLNFNCNNPGASNYSWDFNGEGNNTNACNPGFIFSSPGTKTIRLTLRLSNGQTCTTSLSLTVKAKPEINIQRISTLRQCFRNNTFCFRDSSQPAPGDTIKSIHIQFDDGEYMLFYGNGPRTFCKTYKDPAGGTYGMTVKLTSQNGCISVKRYNAWNIVTPSMGLTFNSPQPARCDSVKLCVTNNSLIALDSIKSFTWDWGDSTYTNGSSSTPQLWKNQVCHTFRAQGPYKGYFTTRLTVTEYSGCTETFTFYNSAANIKNRPVIVTNYDSICASNPVITFKLKDGPVLGAANPLFIFEQPATPVNTLRAWEGPHQFTGPGAYRVSFSFTHSIPGCGRTVSDTILVLGPQSIIEGQGIGFIEDSLRYQCVIKDTVRFTNFSRFYHNDRNMLDDDSTYYDSVGFNRPLGHKFGGMNGQVSVNASPQNRGNAHIQRFWDFDDAYCDQCTTDTRNGVNTMINCRYSKDSLPKHWYTPWDEVYLQHASLLPATYLKFEKDSGNYYKRHLWSDDSIAIVRDTILYYGDNAQALKTKDSVVYLSISKKIKKPRDIRGISSTLFNHYAKLYLETGDTVYIHANNGLPPVRFIGPRYLNVSAGQSIEIKSRTDKALYNVWVEYMQDTIPMHAATDSDKVWKKTRMKGFATGDSVNAAVHRQKFYAGSTVRCYQVKLSQKDMVHPMRCSSEVTASLALQPPSAKQLRKSGLQCLGGDKDNYGMTFILEDTKPGCSRTWAEINFDTAKNKNAWTPAIGKNLSNGTIPAGPLPPLGLPYPGKQVGNQSGPIPNQFSKQYTMDMIKDTINGYVNIGLIVGNGIWPGGNYPQACQDTVYYPKFAKFPILDNSFRVVYPQQGAEYTRICKRDTVSLALMPQNRSDISEVRTASWTLASNNTGKYYNQKYTLSIDETYQRFVKIHPDTPYLSDFLNIVRKSTIDNKTSTLDSQEIMVARITKWHTEADISQAYNEMNMLLEQEGFDISELSPSELATLVWNGKGIRGKAYTGSKGLIDTSGFGHKLLFTIVADEKQTLHYRDTSLLPVDTHKGSDGKIYHAYSFVPQYSGFYISDFSLNKHIPGFCSASMGKSKKVIVGFYGVMNYSDTILCQGSKVFTSPSFHYFEVYPEITFRLLDPEVLKPGRPIHDSIYYNQHAGAYIIRTAVSDSTGCKDTLIQEIFTTSARAKISLRQSRSQCKNLIHLKDSSYVLDAHKNKYGVASDLIVKWTVYIKGLEIDTSFSYYTSIPDELTYELARPGTYSIKLRVETALGCYSMDSVSIFNPGPSPLFDSDPERTYCIGEKISFRNLSKYTRADSSIWTWDFGDHSIALQYDTITTSNDTISHRYSLAGTYQVFLKASYISPTGSSRCTTTYPDTLLGRQPLFIFEIIDCDTTGLDEMTLKRITMYPNPAHNLLTITSQNTADILITDIMGKTVKAFTIHGEQTIDLRNLSPGLYIVTTRNRQVIGKLIIE